MAKLTEEVKTAILKNNQVCIATADKNCVPNIVYINYLKAADDETIVVADNKFDKTRKNLDSNPVLSFAVLDKDTKKAYQIKGRVKCVTEGPEYDSVIEWVHEERPPLTPKAAFYLKVEEIYCGSERLA